VRQIFLKSTVEEEEVSWLQDHDQILGTLKPVSCLWKRPAEMAQMPRATREAVIIKVASVAARRFAHLTDLK
jgi:hypothetical protein